MNVYIVSCYADILYAGTSLKEAKKFQQTIYIYQKGKMCGWLRYEKGKFVKG